VNFWERRLRERVLDRPKRLGLPLNLNDAQAQIRGMYLSEGFKDVKIEIRTSDVASERRIEFLITEGRRYFLGDVLWDGLSAREIEILQGIESDWKARLSTPLHYIYFDERSLKSQIPQLLSMIHAQGFLQARILGFKAVPGKRKDRMDLEVPIQLGPRFILREVMVEGQHPLSEERLDEIVNLEPGEIAREDRILAIAQELTREVKEQGFLNPNISTKIEDIVTYSDTSDEVDLKYTVEMGAQVRVGQIVVEGLKKTKEKVILREFERENMSWGDLWVPSKLEDIDQRLLYYGLFGNLRIQGASERVMKQASETENGVEVQERDLRVSVTERPGGAIEFGPGYRTDLGVVAFGEYNYRNLWGMNRSVVVRGQVSRKLSNYQFLEQKYSLNYLEPYVFNFPVSFRFGTAFEKRDEIQYDKNDSPIAGFNKEEVSISFAVGKEFSRHVSLSHNLYTLSNPKIYDIQEEDTSGEQVYRIATMGPTLTLDYRDSIFNPTRGRIFTTSFEYSSPSIGSTDEVHYLLNKNEFGNYALLRPGFVLATSLSLAHMQTLGGVPSLPIDRRLVLGGRASVRSLQEKAIRYDNPGVTFQDSYLLKAELRQDLFDGLGFAYFFDMGRVDARGFAGQGWREALGIGVRYVTPVGPLALDFAFNADQRPNEDFSRILFSVGVF
jgi:outer membrane protein insertion porin family